MIKIKNIEIGGIGGNGGYSGKRYYMGLTLQEIREDIAGYEDRIHLAKINLANLPEGRLSFKEHKRRERQRRDLQAEIKHCFQLISYANEGIQLRLAEAA